MATVERIYTNLIDFQIVNECEIVKIVNNHGYARISGVLRAGMNVETALQGQTWLTIMAENESGKHNLFSGIISSMSVGERFGVAECEIELIGSTKLMDIEKMTRTFQDESMPYDLLLDEIGRDYQAVRLGTGFGKATGNFYVQYNETDWEFLLRIASNVNACVIPQFIDGKIVYNIGLPNSGDSCYLDVLEYQKKKELNCFRQYGSRFLRNCEVDSLITFKSKKILELGSKVVAEQDEYYVYQSKMIYEKNEVVFEYEIRKACDFEVKKHYNFMLVGASLDAEIIDVKASKVKVCVSVDGQQKSESAKWFPYSSVFSSPDGTGWYCMPEIGDNVRMYFPSEKEKDAYIISSVHVGEGAGARTNPDNKSLMNKFNKQVELTPTTITLTNGNGMSFILDDEKGITIASNKDINFVAAEGVQIVSLSQKVEVAASQEINLAQQNSSIKMNGDIQFKAGEMRIQQ